jgi:hypothetical protein
MVDIYAAITRQKKETDSPAANMDVSVHLASDDPKAAMVVFEPQFWAEPIGFKITTSKKNRKNRLALPCLQRYAANFHI